MATSDNNNRIDYIEFPVTSVTEAKRFYGSAFGWSFEDYGPDYASFHDGRLAGGFRGGAEGGPGVQGGVLVVLYATDLEAAERRVKAAGGRIVKSAFSFPGGRRFHFTDPSGHELAVWSEK